MPRVLVVAIALVVSLAALPVSASGTARSSAHPRIHVVYPGQTLAMIAKRYHVGVDALRRANDIHRGKLKPKQKLIIPEKDDKDGSRARQLRDSGFLDPHTRPAAAKTSVHAKPGQAPDGGYARKPRHPGYVIMRSTVGSWNGYAVRKGKVPKGAGQAISRVLASWRTRQKLAIDERLIRMIAQVSDHFGGRPIRVVSGFRPYRPTQYTQHSQHNLGHAVDFSIPGVPNTVLRDFCRTLVNAGCGYYPNSSFVHMDARDLSAYWVDFAGPGEAPRYATARGADPASEEREAAEHEHEPDHGAAAVPDAAPDDDHATDAPADGSKATHSGTSEKSGE